MEDGFFCLQFIGFIINILIAVWMYKDAKKRYENSILWLILGLFLGIIGLIIWLVFRPAMEDVEQKRQGGYQQKPPPPPAPYSERFQKSVEDSETKFDGNKQLERFQNTTNRNMGSNDKLLEGSRNLSQENNDHLKKIKKIEKGIDSLKKDEKMIDTRKINQALEEGKIERAEDHLFELQENYEEYTEVLDTLKKLDQRRYSLAEQLADGKIDRDTYNDANQSITHRKAELEEKLSKLRNKVVYEDYEKPF